MAADPADVYQYRYINHHRSHLTVMAKQTRFAAPCIYDGTRKISRPVEPQSGPIGRTPDIDSAAAALARFCLIARPAKFGRRTR
jgi:hypothetical protein